MKYYTKPSLVILFSLIIAFPYKSFAQETPGADTLEKEKSTLLLFGKIQVKPHNRPMKKAHFIPKLEIFGLIQKRIGLEMEFPINKKSSLILHAFRQQLNSNEPHRSPGIYKTTYTRTDVSSTTWVIFFPITTNSSHTSPGKFDDWGYFLPTVEFAIQPHVRTYFGSKTKRSCFYMEQGLKVLILKGVNINDWIAMIDEKKTITGDALTTTTTTISSFNETRTVTAGKKEKASIGLISGFGFRANINNLLQVDLGLETVIQANHNWHGLKKIIFILPQIQLGCRL